MYRTCTSKQISKELCDKTVLLAGFVSSVRDHGGVLFVDLRDHYGVVQIVVHNDIDISHIKKESVISVSGIVQKRNDDAINSSIATGDVEVKAESIKILSSSIDLPFEINNTKVVNEETRLKYRFLDLRNDRLHKNIVLRAQIISFIRKQMEKLDFLEVQTPILSATSPEGARDYLVPSRKHKGMFYALPQAPQQFKQLLMVSNFDKYFQIAPCFRDEDARADRSPGEFYQLDFEMAYATQEDVFRVAESVLSKVFKKFSNKKVSKTPFKKITYNDALLNYGTDKPDLRNPLIINDLTSFFANVDFAPFKNKQVRGILAPKAVNMSKSFFEQSLKFATEIGMKGLGYISFVDGECKGPIAKFLDSEQKNRLIKDNEIKNNDVIFFISDDIKKVNNFAGQIRNWLGEKLDIIDRNAFEFCFVVDFPMYCVDEETGKIEFMHNPFSMPQGELDALNTSPPLDIYAYQYDIVCNGIELSSGAVRNHKLDVMIKAFDIAGYSEDVLKAKFSALYNAFKYGAPPHAGMAPGIDRIVMLLTGEENIREVIAFPLNGNAQDLLLGAPCKPTEKQLREANIAIIGDKHDNKKAD